MNPYLDNPMQSDATQFAGTAEHSNSPLKTYTLLAKGSGDLVQQDYDAIQDAGFNNPLRQARDLPSAKRELASERLQLRLQIRPLERSPTKPYDNSFFHALFRQSSQSTSTLNLLHQYKALSDIVKFFGVTEV